MHSNLQRASATLPIVPLACASYLAGRPFKERASHPPPGGIARKIIMKMHLWLALPAALTAIAFSQPASAAVVTYTYAGKVDTGFDGAGLFGGGQLGGKSFTA